MKILYYIIIFLLVQSGLNILFSEEVHLLKYPFATKLPLLPSILVAGFIFYGAYIIWDEHLR